MADVFLSYARDEAARAEEIRRALEGLGLTVFHDVERLDAGDVWSDVIDRELKTAGAVVALWSPHALSRPWVKKECAVAQSRGVLVPAILESVTDLDMPTQFSDLQRVDLSDFHGQPDHTGWRKLVRALAKVLKRKDLLAAQIEALKEEKQTAKVKAELESAQEELRRLRNLKGGVKPVFVVAGLVALLSLGALGMWWGMGEMTRREVAAKNGMRASIVDPEVMAALSAISDDRRKDADGRRRIEAILQKVSLPRLIEASTVDADAAFVAGWVYIFGEFDAVQSDSEASRFFKRSCDLGNMRGCASLGAMHADGTGVVKDEAQAVTLFRRACEREAVEGCRSLGIMYENGRGVAKDEGRAAELYRQACEADASVGCHNLSNMYADGLGVEKDEARALSLLAQACNGGDLLACYAAGMNAMNGRGSAKDEARAVSLFTQACDGGLAAGCNNLGYMYRNGKGTQQDYLRAAALYAQACNEGVATSCVELGNMHADGQGVAKDDSRTAALFGQACDAKAATGCRNLGVMYGTGQGVTKDVARQVALYRRACELGDQDVCGWLSELR